MHILPSHNVYRGVVFSFRDDGCAIDERSTADRGLREQPGESNLNEFTNAQVAVPENKELEKIGNKGLLELIRKVLKSPDKFLRLSKSSIYFAQEFSNLSSLSPKQLSVLTQVLVSYRDSNVAIPAGVDPVQFFLEKENEFIPRLKKAMETDGRITKKLTDPEEFELLRSYYVQFSNWGGLTFLQTNIGEQILFRLEKRRDTYIPIGLIKEKINSKCEPGQLAKDALEVVKKLFNSTEDDYKSSIDQIMEEIIKAIDTFPHDEKIEFSRLFRQYLIDEKLIAGNTYPFFEKFSIELLVASLEPNNNLAIETLNDFILGENGFKLTSKQLPVLALNSLCALENNPIVLEKIEAIHRKNIPGTKSAAVRYLTAAGSSSVPKIQDPPEVKRQQVVEEIRKLWNEGYLPIPGWIKKEKKELYNLAGQGTTFHDMPTALKAAKIPAFCEKLYVIKPVNKYKEKDSVAQRIQEKYNLKESLELMEMAKSRDDLRLLIAGIFHYGSWPNAVKENTELEIKFPLLEDVTPASIERVAYKAGIENAFPV